jgi:transposase
MNNVTIIGIDLAKRVFHAHGAHIDGSVAFRKRLTRAQMLPFLSAQPRCVVAMEACASAHEWGRAIQQLGHDVRLIPPSYVKPYVKRQKNDTADAEAIAEAGSRPTMRFVAVKTEEQQARSMVFRTRDLLVRQRTQLINALRGHLAEHGLVVPQGPAHLKTLAKALDATDVAMPQLVRDIGRLYLEQIEQLNTKVADLEKALRREAQFGEETRRLQTMPGIGPITAMAVEAFAPPMQTFKRGRDFAAWLGLVPVQHSTGGKQRLGRTSKMGQRDIRRLLIIGAMAVIRWASRRGARPGSWLSRMMDRKPLMLVAVALANKMARAIWAMQTKKEDYRDPDLAAA